jgi:hypothetical protein
VCRSPLLLNGSLSRVSFDTCAYLSILKQNLKALVRLLRAHTLDDLKKVPPEEAHELSALYRNLKKSVFSDCVE